ncbi:MAG TPA: glycoside hydrolase family 3 N-terminal domain-containing protein [Ktedonobacteraceae bacterium]|nr:glycoside hydrolase family 3 N-terminal domain-containing protein [Ktedonobacteraceae bacterium]
MTINNEYKNPSPVPYESMKFDDEDDETPRRIPVPPRQHAPIASSRQNAWIPPSRHTLPAPQQEPVVAQLPTWSAAPTRVMPAQYQPPYYQNFPPVPPPQTRRSKPRRTAKPLVVTLALLTILVILGVFFSQQLQASTGTASSPDSSPQNAAPAHAGQFVLPPLNASQLDSLRHLVSYMQYKQLASMYVSRMSLDVELGQLIMVEYSDTYYSSDLDTMVNKLHAGGVIMYEFQMNTFNQTKHDIAQMQQHATFPLLISTDEEGGPYVHRLSHIDGYRMSATDIYNTGNPAVATQQGHKTAHDLAALGINEDLAPDVDVNLVNGYDMVTRTFGNDTASVIKFAGAYMQAMQSYGVIACIKHYPGLGAAVTDAHKGLPVVNRSRQQLYDVELAPFKAFIQTQNKLDNPGMIMPTDVLMPAIDPVYPAELSHIFMTDILRKQFGYDGVVLTDALYMQGITQKWSMPEAAVLALQAGNDMLLGPNGTGQMIEMLNAIKQALKDGRLTKARIDEAATRIIALKMQYHLMPAMPPQL